MKHEEFLALQKEWYEKLANSGFKDIEVLKNGNLHLTKNIVSRQYDAEVAKRARMREEYYRGLRHFVDEPSTKFRNSVDLFIMLLRSNGYSTYKIYAELIAAGIKRNHRTVVTTIRKYEHRWGIRFWTRKQRGLKSCKIPTT